MGTEEWNLHIRKYTTRTSNILHKYVLALTKNKFKSGIKKEGNLLEEL